MHRVWTILVNNNRWFQRIPQGHRGSICVDFSYIVFFCFMSIISSAGFSFESNVLLDICTLLIWIYFIKWNPLSLHKLRQIWPFWATLCVCQITTSNMFSQVLYRLHYLIIPYNSTNFCCYKIVAYCYLLYNF